MEFRRLDRSMPYIAGSFKQTPIKNQHYGLRKTTWILALTISLVLVLAIIATSFAALQTAKGRKAEDRCTKDKELVPRHPFVASLTRTRTEPWHCRYRSFHLKPVTILALRLCLKQCSRRLGARQPPLSHLPRHRKRRFFLVR